MSDNRRGTFRCASPAGQAVLRVGHKDSTVELLDQSAEGYAVGGSRLRGDIGQHVLLRTARGWSEVEVVRREQEGSRVTLGLRQLRDLPDPRALEEVTGNRPVLFLPRSSTPSGAQSLLGFLLLAGMGLVACFWAAMAASAWLGTP